MEWGWSDGRQDYIVQAHEEKKGSANHAGERMITLRRDPMPEQLDVSSLFVLGRNRLGAVVVISTSAISVNG